MKRRMPRLMLGLALVGPLLLAACAEREYRGGFVLEEETLNRIKVGETTQRQVAATLGSPSSISTFNANNDTWYYISKETRAMAFLTPEVIDQQVLAIDFDPQGRVKDIRRYGLKDGREIAFVDRSTPTRGRELTILQQLLGNLGRFNDRSTGRPGN